MIALDTETRLIEKGNLAPPLVCVSFASADLGFAVVLPWNDPNIVTAIRETLKHGVVGHNIAYDMAVILEQFPELSADIFRAYDENLVTDTMLREQLIHIAGGVYRGYDTSSGFIGINYSLAEMAKRHLAVELDKNAWRLRYGELRDVPFEAWPTEAVTYSRTDAMTTYQLWYAQEKNSEYIGDQYSQARAAFWLHLCSCAGIQTDLVAVKALRARWETEREELKIALQADGLVDVEGRRKMKVARNLMATVFPDGPKTPTGEASLDAQACEDSADLRLVNFAKYSSFSTKFSTDIPILEQGLIQPRYTTLMESGRTSASKPNIQNIRREPGVRECYVPRPGKIFVIADYSGFELHTWAQACIDLVGRSTMADALNAGKDPHAMVATWLGFEPDHVNFTEARQVGKVANFGFPGGLGINGFRAFALSGYGIHLTESDATRIRNAWQKSWPEAAEYFRVVNATLRNDSIKQLRVPRVRGNVTYCQACNTLFQGLAADAAKAAGWELTKDTWNKNRLLYGCSVVAFIHDEFIVEVPESLGDYAAKAIENIMKRTADRYTPDVPNKVDVVLARRWSKKAKRVFSTDGRLIPWDET